MVFAKTTSKFVNGPLRALNPMICQGYEKPLFTCEFWILHLQMSANSPFNVHLQNSQMKHMNRCCKQTNEEVQFNEIQSGLEDFL